MRLLHIFTCLFFASAYSQVGIGTSSPNSSALLDMTSTNKGFLLPRLSLTGINDNTSILNPANGLLVFNLAAAGTGSNAVAANSLYFRQNSVWQKFTSDAEVSILESSNQYVLRSVANQVLTDVQVSSINSSETYEVPVIWSSDEVLIDDPNDIELMANNQTFKVKTTGYYRVLANFSFTPKRSVTENNSNYSYVTISLLQSKDSGVTWIPVSGTAMPFDNGSTAQSQTLIIPRTILSFAKDDQLKISISKPGTATPVYGSGAGIVAKTTGDITKLFRIRNVN